MEEGRREHRWCDLEFAVDSVDTSREMIRLASDRFGIHADTGIDAFLDTAFAIGRDKLGK